MKSDCRTAMLIGRGEAGRKAGLRTQTRWVSDIQNPRSQQRATGEFVWEAHFVRKQETELRRGNGARVGVQGAQKDVFEQDHERQSKPED